MEKKTQDCKYTENSHRRDIVQILLALLSSACYFPSSSVNRFTFYFLASSPRSSSDVRAGVFRAAPTFSVYTKCRVYRKDLSLFPCVITKSAVPCWLAGVRVGSVWPNVCKHRDTWGPPAGARVTPGLAGTKTRLNTAHDPWD